MRLQGFALKKTRPHLDSEVLAKDSSEIAGARIRRRIANVIDLFPCCPPQSFFWLKGFSGENTPVIQILALRTYEKDGQTKISEKWFDKRIRSESVESILLDPQETLAAIEQSELFNVYYTVCECLEEPGRKFLRQSVVPFDIDGLDLPFDSSYPSVAVEKVARVTCDAIGVAFEEVGIVFSGNGVQILVPLDEPFSDKEYFDNARHHYKAICERIDGRLSEHNIKGHADPSVWSPARLLRHPDTYNRKVKKPERKAQVVNSAMTTKGWSLEKSSGIPVLKAGDHLNPKAVFENFTCDPGAILDKNTGCDFLKAGFAEPSKMLEPQWYAGLSIVGRFPDAQKWAHDFSKGHPKYSYKETETKLKQATSSSSGPRTCKNIEGLGWNCQACPNYQKVTSPITIEGPDSIKTMKSGFYFQKVTKEGDLVKGPPDYEGLWKFFKRTHDYASVSDSPEMYAFKGKHWELITGDDVRSFAQKNFKPAPMDRERREFLSFVKISNLVKRDHFESSMEGLFNFQNGVFDMKEGKLYPHSKEFPFRHTLPCDYDVNATAPRFERFMREVTCDRQPIIDCLQEYMGYIIAGGECKFEKALVLLGRGANGKSTFANVLRLLTGTAASSLSAKDLADDRKRLGVVGKILNIAEENSRDSFSDPSTMKNMISGGVTWAKQLYSQPFEFRNKAKFVFLCNELPRNYDNTDGFYRKLLILPFDARFSQDLGTADVKLIHQLETEISGIFNFALQGYQRLLETGAFTRPEESAEIVDEYSYASDHIKSWMRDEVDIISSDQVRHTKDGLYENYQEYCAKAGVKAPEPRNRFFMDLKAKVQMLGINWRESKPLEEGVRKKFVYYIQPKGPHIGVVIHKDGVTFEYKD